MVSWIMNGTYPLVNSHKYGKAPSLIGKQMYKYGALKKLLCWITRGYVGLQSQEMKLCTDGSIKIDLPQTQQLRLDSSS